MNLETSADSGWAVETHGLTKRFGDNVAVNDVELLVPRGCAFGYLGPNGAGKTTLIRVPLGLARADAGTMSLLACPVPKHRDVALARVGAIVDEPRFHGHLTGRQNLQILAAAREPAALGPDTGMGGLPVACVGCLTQLRHRDRLDLADALTRQVEVLADLLERTWFAPIETEAQ